MKKLQLGKVIQGDCREVMATFPINSIGMIVTSPPYNVKLNYEGFEDDMPEDKFKDFNAEWLEQAYRVAMDASRLYVVVSDKMIFWFKDYAEKVNWTFVQKLTWCKPNLVSSTKNISQDWDFMSEDILLFRKGKRTPMLSDRTSFATTHNWFVETTPQSNFKGGRIHPAQMPLRLCQKLITRTPGNPILDPFAGSGQVLRAARSLGRDYIGIELVASVATKARDFIMNSNIAHSQYTFA